MTASRTSPIRPARAADEDAVLAIREDAIRTSPGLWIDHVPPRDELRSWFRNHVQRGSMLVAEADDRVVGYANHAQLRDHEGYRWTAEDSVYLAPSAQGRGLGRLLLEALVEAAAAAGMHSLVGMIEAGNTASIILHERCGFTTVGTIPQAGRKFDRWMDLRIMQRLV